MLLCQDYSVFGHLTSSAGSGGHRNKWQRFLRDRLAFPHNLQIVHDLARVGGQGGEGLGGVHDGAAAQAHHAVAPSRPAHLQTRGQVEDARLLGHDEGGDRQAGVNQRLQQGRVARLARAARHQQQLGDTQAFEQRRQPGRRSPAEDNAVSGDELERVGGGGGSQQGRRLLCHRLGHVPVDPGGEARLVLGRCPRPRHHVLHRLPPGRVVRRGLVRRRAPGRVVHLVQHEVGGVVPRAQQVEPADPRLGLACTSIRECSSNEGFLAAWFDLHIYKHRE
mmetsp:Transcript_6410/g.10251  ORF Transcript_6410/g.10251 Transcript_6410/m.10251 type:complete len:278 (-) Transcript_6410:448-1281(-)